MNRSAISIALAALFSGAWLLPQTAHAFCGFYASSASGKLYNDATQVVMMRDGDKTVLSMRNTYQGPPKDFALVIPVPKVLKKEDVRTLGDAIFEKVDRLTSPKLVEYWQRDPCYRNTHTYFYNFDDTVIDGEFNPKDATSPKIEAAFEVGEYDVVILSAKESNSLEKWLLDHGYSIPEGASKALAPYIAQGMYFFVAKVNAKKVKFDSKGNALLSPLRFHYRSQEFSLPVRLGLLNAKGPQDLIVHIISRAGRFQVANRPNAFIPTNLLVPANVKGNFSQYYENLFAYTRELRPEAIFTEYAWETDQCDPCPKEALSAGNLLALGAAIVDGLKTSEKALIREDYVLAATTDDLAYRKAATDIVRAASRGEGWRGCYEALLSRRGPRTGHVKLQLLISPDGEVDDVTFLDRNLGDWRFQRCLKKRFRALGPGPKSNRENSYITQVEFTTRETLELEGWSPVGWTITRLHARYDAKTMTEDLIFEKAAPVAGGSETPTGQHGEFAKPSVETSAHNRFQARYVILHPWEDAIECKATSQTISWNGLSRRRETSNAKTSTPALSKELEQQIREQLQQPLPSTRTSR